MARTHQITCAHDECPERSTFITFQPVAAQQIAADHRAKLAADNWTDLEGRDYCPSHTPTGVTR
jgi:hypothetical protein